MTIPGDTPRGGTSGERGPDRPEGASGAVETGMRPLPPIPRTSWIVRVLVPAGDIWRAEKRIRALEVLPALGDPIALEDETPARVAGVCSPAMSGVHADVYAAPDGSGR